MEVLISARKSTFDRHEFAITEESVDYTSKFRKLAKNGDLENKEGVVIRDVFFFTNLIDSGFRKELHEKITEHRKTLDKKMQPLTVVEVYS